MIWFKLCEPRRSLFLLFLKHAWSLKITIVAFILRYSQDIFVSLRAKTAWGPRRPLSSVQHCLLLLNILFLSVWCQTGLRGTFSCRALLSWVWSHPSYCTWLQSFTGLLWLFHTFFARNHFQQDKPEIFPQKSIAEAKTRSQGQLE